MQPARSPVQTRSRVAAAQEPLWEPPVEALSGSRLQDRWEPSVEAVETAPVGVPEREGGFSQAVGVAGGGFFSWDKPDEMEGLGERARNSAAVKFNGKNSQMWVSKLKQIHQREVSFHSGRRGHNMTTITQTEKHFVLMTLLEGEAYTAMNDHFRGELDGNALARERVDLQNRAREDEVLKRYNKAYAVYLRHVELLDEQEAARVAAEEAAEAAKSESGLPSPVEITPAADAPAVYPAEPIHRAPPKLPPPDIPDIMDRAWAFLERTFKEVTPELEKAYMFFDYKAGRSTIITLSTLEELCRLTGKPMEGRAVVSKAINALRRELQGHLEREQLLWSPSQLTLAHVRQRALEIEEALRTAELELAPLALAKAAKGVDQLTVEDRPKKSAPAGEKTQKEGGENSGRRNRDKGEAQEKGQAFAVTAPVAEGKPAFNGECYNCKKRGHMKANCPDLKNKPAGSGRKPGAVCNSCHKVDFHTEDECWEKNPQMKPDKWRKRGGEAKPAYAADTVEPSAPPPEEMGQPGFTAWTAAVSTNRPREAFAVFADKGPELRPTTLEQRDTTPAARAKREAERQAARAKEDRVRLGGPPPGFRQQGERRAEEGSDAPPAAPKWAAGGDSHRPQRR
jgi:hypothetical protein